MRIDSNEIEQEKGFKYSGTQFKGNIDDRFREVPKRSVSEIRGIQFQLNKNGGWLIGLYYATYPFSLIPENIPTSK